MIFRSASLMDSKLNTELGAAQVDQQKVKTAEFYAAQILQTQKA